MGTGQQVRYMKKIQCNDKTLKKVESFFYLGIKSILKGPKGITEEICIARKFYQTLNLV
jgi:hypothetical protein